MNARPRGEKPNDDTSQILLRIAATLQAFASDTKPLERWRAAAYAEQLRRIANPPKAIRGRGKELAVSLSYAIRRELYPHENFKKSRAKTANIFDIAERSVSTIATRHRLKARGFLERMSFNIEYQGLTRRQMLRRELSELEPRRTRVQRQK
jgi:hypothetical protein